MNLVGALAGRAGAHDAIVAGVHRLDVIAGARELTALRRELIRHEFWAQAPPMTTNPKLTQPQSPSAHAAA